jgi:ubiquinone/menaquinone biosynthesis C-methylase UbiE
MPHLDKENKSKLEMSSYEDYTQTSKHYDQTREPVGTEIIVGCFAHAPTPLNRMMVLDAGCGTGSYSQALLDYIGWIEAVDLNPGMLEVAAQKLAPFQAEGRISFHSCPIDELPFADATLDGVMINQVLHHLPDDAPKGFPAHERVFLEFARVLKPNGVLTVNTCSQEQIRHGYWHYSLIPEAADALRARYAPLDELIEILDGCGFAHQGRFAPVDATVQGKAYFDPHGPLNKQWRNGDSVWSLVTEDRLEQVFSRIHQLDAKGGLDTYMAHNDARRRDIGQATILFSLRR